MNWYVQNLRCGLRAAVFFPLRQHFVGTWHALMAIAAATVLSQLVMEFDADGKGGEFAYSCAQYLACLFSFTLIFSYIIGFAVGQGKHVLDIAVAFLNAYYFVFLPYAFVQIAASEEFYGSSVAHWLEFLIPVWAFAVVTRIVRVICGVGFRKCIASGMLAGAAIYLLNSHVLFNRIYYVERPVEARKPSPLDKMTSEELFGMQANLRQKSLDKMKASKPGQTDIYALTLGTYSYQDVFMRDVRYVDTRLKWRWGITNIIPMINNREVSATTPLANTTNLKSYLAALSAHFMQPKEDILLLFLTSHGSAKDGVAVNLDYRFTQQDISPQALRKILDDSGIQNRIIIISACYSGTFIPALKDEHTIVITAAAKDKVSFGCSDKNDLTYFTQAYFMDALSQTTGVEKAFDIAKEVVQKREADMGITDHSNPQIFVGSKIRSVLRNYTGADIAARRRR